MTARTLHPALIATIDLYKSDGAALVSVAEFCRRFAALGYRVDRGDDCKAFAQWMTGPLAGRSYPSCSTGIREADTGRSAWHFESRRDDNFQAMQALRGQVIALTRDGYLLNV